MNRQKLPLNSFAEIDAYVEQQMRRLNIPGASLAIVEGDEIAHLLLGTLDYFGKKSRDLGLKLRLFGWISDRLKI
jgi:hypothetical protein